MKSVLRLLALTVVLCAVPMSRAGSNCGDGDYQPDLGEECDDGNNDNGDGCSSTCILENCGNGSVDPYEECDDTQGPCCDRCHYVPNFTFCREAQGDCDLADYCTGQDAECLDFKKDDGELCRAVNGACDYPESCDGSSPSCPPDSYLFDDNEPCRAAVGDCDEDEYCGGNSPNCPPDVYSSNELCRDLAGICDEVEYCDGTSPNCPPDGFLSGETCRGPEGDCDERESCDGTSADCPPDEYNTGDLCRSAAGACDQEEYCDGTSIHCPFDSYLNGDICRPPAYSCDLPESCTGDSPDCPPDEIAADDSICDDSDACTGQDSCAAGVCVGHEPTEDPLCYPAPSGLVSWWPAEGTPEDIVGDNDGTFLGETGYDAGRVGQAFTFDGSGDGILMGDRPTLRLTNALTIDAWIYFYDVPNNSLAAIVSKWFQGDSAAYLFTVEEFPLGSYRLHAYFRLAGGAEPSILGGVLLPFHWYHVAVTFDVDTGNAALWIDGHNVATSALATQPLSAGAADFSIGFENFNGRYFHGLIDEIEVFSRGLSETELLGIHDACGTGKCRYCTGDAECTDNNPCTHDTCVNARCLHTPADGEDCSDGNACTAYDVCRGGECVCGLDTLGCVALLGEPCTTACGVLCDDGIGCTIDTCDSEVGCVFTPHNSPCDDQKPCTDDICVPEIGCTYRPNDANSCSDGNHCNLERCSGGECVVTPVDCDDHNACTRDVCHYETGCAFSPISCDDSNACTTDSCDPATGCKYTPRVCNDYNKCTIDSCDPETGQCVYTPKVCTASDSCHTAGTCNPSTGTCSNPTKPTGSTCDDGNACTRTDTCQYGTCRGSSPVSCTAQDSCHSAGVCDRTTGQCSNPVKANGTTCSDGTLCTKYDKCQSGVCTGTPVVCGPPDSCHDPGTCNPSTGYCSNPAKPNGSTCSDGNACTRTDACSNGYCRGSDPVVCTASDSCHKAGVCNTTSGVCSDPIKPNGSSCSDGNSCTVGDVCSNGACRPGGPPRCAPCTLNGDATVKQSSQYSNYGYSSELQARGTTPTWALLRFHVSGVTGQPVTGVHVKLTVKSASATSGGSLHRVPCTWYEGSVNWSSKPALGPALDSEGAVVQNQVVDFDVTSVVTLDGDYCFAIDNPAGADVLYYSREAPSGRPQIVVDAGCACVP